VIDLVPENLKYTKDHEWAKIEGDTVTVGITDHAQHELGDVVFTELPATGRSLKQGEEFGVVESVKSVSSLYSPISGDVSEKNEKVISSQETVNKDPYGDGWMIKIKVKDLAEAGQLLSAKDYSKLIGE
jgi:glycine cleavage system H protein